MQLIFFFSTFLLASTFLALLIRYSDIVGMVDIPNSRSAHKRATPRSGGIAIFGAFMLSSLLFNLAQFVEYFYIYSAISIIFLIGFLDDKFDVSPRLKFLFIFISTLILYLYGLEISSIGTYFGYTLNLTAWIILPFTFFAVAGFTNSLNLMDGLDGLAGSIALIILIAFLSIGILNNDELMITLSLSLIGTIIAFLLFNWNPAKIFMGDSGSLTIGFIIALLSILSLQYINPTAVLFIIALPLLDTFIVMTRRIQRGISPFSADKNHIHHFLYNVKMDVPFVVILLASIQGAFTLIGYQIRSAESVLSLLLFCLMFYIFLSLFDQRLKRRKQKGITKKRFAAIRTKVSKQKPVETSTPDIPDEQEAPSMIPNVQH